MLMHTREGTTIVRQQEKVTNETRQQMALLCSILSVIEKASLLIYDGQFSFLHQAKLSQAHFTRYIF